MGGTRDIIMLVWPVYPDSPEVGATAEHKVEPSKADKTNRR
jgi:hypothetical protein